MENKTDFSRVSVGTWVRTAALLLALVNQILAVFGKHAIPIYENDLMQIASAALTVGSAMVSWWRNNSFTEVYQTADAYAKVLCDNAAGHTES